MDAIDCFQVLNDMLVHREQMIARFGYASSE
jgi:hypothetical protein